MSVLPFNFCSGSQVDVETTRRRARLPSKLRQNGVNSMDTAFTLTCGSFRFRSETPLMCKSADFRQSGRRDGNAIPDPAAGPRRLDAGARAQWPAVVPGVEVIRKGRIEPFLAARPALTSTAIRWGGLAVEDYRIPACVIPPHEHVHHFVHVVLSGA